MPAPWRACDIKSPFQHSSKEPRSYRIQLQWAKTAVGPGGDGFSVFGPHQHSIMVSQREYSKATAQNNSNQLGAERQNEKRGADNADLPCGEHHDTQKSFQWDSPAPQHQQSATLQRKQLCQFHTFDTWVGRRSISALYCPLPVRCPR